MTNYDSSGKEPSKRRKGSVDGSPRHLELFNANMMDGSTPLESPAGRSRRRGSWNKQMDLVSSPSPNSSFVNIRCDKADCEPADDIKITVATHEVMNVE